jgi:gamma-glutamylaminecyclotransferase
VDAFVYGTLCDPERARELLGRADFGPEARLVGLERVDGRYPTLAPGGETSGRILRLEQGDLDSLDEYEGVEGGLYVRVRVPFESGWLWTYVGDPERLDADAAWPGDGTFGARVRRYVERNDVFVRRSDTEGS